jgi:NADH-quinone oxidoreductase subunit L
MLDLIWIVPALPLLGFVVLLFGGKRIGEPLAGIIATATTALSFLVGVLVFIGLVGEPGEERLFVQTLWEWIPAGNFSVDVGFLVDPLSITWVLFVTGIGALIHLYSIGYMHGDPRYRQYFCYLNLFVFSMLVLVIADNFLLTFLGWEGVGACSYFLISFWFEKKENATAGKKAFVTNRVGDWGFLVAMFLTFFTFGSLDYAEVLPQVTGLAPATATAIALLFFVGAVGKSAQLPLFVWLPDAMAGPTPVSALIHAATMVTAGVYLMVRINPILDVSWDWVGPLIAWIGVITALVAATIACAQNDIKKVLAYSTISQLGFMFLAVGSGAYAAAVFHVITHAFFKGLLFLGAGSVIHGMSDEQDMRKMGGLRKEMPVTAITFAVGALAIAGVPPLAGFWSKDEILAFGGDEAFALVVVGLVAALMTAYYMSRQYFLVFEGEARFDQAEVHPHESPWTMTGPLVVLAVLAVFGGFLNLPFSEDLKVLEHWLHPSIPFEAELTLTTAMKWLLALVSALVAVIGAVVGYLIYDRKRVPAERMEPEVMRQGWYIDQAYAWFVSYPGKAFFQLCALFDKKVIDGAVNAVGRGARDLGGALRVTQGGLVRGYAMGVSVGAALLTAWILTRATF